MHYIDVVVHEGLRNADWRYTYFYGWPEVQNIHLSWSLLSTLMTNSELPWLYIGDFNEVLIVEP